MRIIVLLSYPQSGLNAIHIVSALNLFTPVCNVMSVLVEMVNFAIGKVDNFCKNKLIAVLFKLFEGNTQELLFPNRNDKRFCVFGCSMIAL